MKRGIIMILCLREEFFDNIHDSPLKASYLLLSCAFCDFCGIINGSGETIDITASDSKLISLFVLPLFSIVRNANEKHALIRAMSMVMLEKVQDSFGGINSYDEEEIAVFIKSYNEQAQEQGNKENRKQRNLTKQYQNISECSYLELQKRVIYNEQYATALNMTMNFFLMNVGVRKQGLRSRFHYIRGERPYYKENIFMDVRRSLDEGMTEWITKILCGDSDESIGPNQSNRSLYHTEVSFIKKLMHKFHEEKLVAAYMLENPIEFIFGITRKSHKCDFYKIYKYTDNLNWRSAIALLNRLPLPLETKG